MYVCVCHALTDADVQSAEAEGAACESEVFEHYGVRPRCGRCVPTMRCMLECENRKSGRCCGEEAAEKNATTS